MYQSLPKNVAEEKKEYVNPRKRKHTKFLRRDICNRFDDTYAWLGLVCKTRYVQKLEPHES